LGQAPHSESNKKKASARFKPYKNIKQGLWPFRTELWLARAWFAGQAFQSRHIKHAPDVQKIVKSTRDVKTGSILVPGVQRNTSRV
jgi:hypothetical protein